MKTSKPLRVSIVGCGTVTQWHIVSLLKNKNVELVAICDRNEDLARRAAIKFNIDRYYSDFSKMLLNEKVDLVDICTPPQTHLSLSTQVIEAGHHVLIEKPMALSVKEADEMAMAAKKNRVELSVVHNELFLPVVMRARSMVSEKVIGDLVGISITDSIPRDNAMLLNREHWCHKLPGGIFGEMLPHPLYLATAFLGRLEPIAVYNRKLSSYDWLVADELRVILEGENGIATITESVNWPKDIMVLDIFGTKMSLHVDIWGAVMTEYAISSRGRFSRGLENLGLGFQRLGGTASMTFSVISGRFYGGHNTFIKKFVNSLQSGTELPVTLEEAREVVRLYEAITTQILGDGKTPVIFQAIFISEHKFKAFRHGKYPFSLSDLQKLPSFA
ncbi:Gfo/Idh/MocA family protein [Chloroflexota bacterium]